MKKIVSLILTVSFVISASLCLSSGIFADAAPTLTVVNEQTVSAGETFTVTVEMSNNPGLWSTKILLYFDPELVCESVDAGEIFSAGEMTLANDLNRSCANNKTARAAFDGRGIAPQDYNSACVFFVNDDDVDNTTNGVLATFTMRAPSEPGTYFIGVLDALGDVINNDSEDVYFSYINSSIVVEESVQVKLGDVNGDNLINVKDITTLKKYLASSITIDEIVVQNSDIDGSGTIGVRDLNELKSLIAGN